MFDISVLAIYVAIIAAFFVFSVAISLIIEIVADLVKGRGED